jgi:hypothetical protein
MVASRCKVIFSKVHLGLDDSELVAEVLESIVLATETSNFGGGIPIVEVGDSVAECVEGGGWAIEEGVKPYGKRLRNV